MKKIIALLCACLICGSALFAQETDEQKWTVRASGGYFPTVPTLASLFGAIIVGIAVEANEESNEKLDIEIPPYFGVDVLYNFNSRWSAGFSTGYTGCVWKVVDKDTGAVNKEKTSYLTFVPVTVVGRCNYLARPKCKLYGSIEGGVTLALDDEVDLGPCFQINPFGVEFGSRFFGLFELGAGVNYIGGRFGIGYRF